MRTSNSVAPVLQVWVDGQEVGRHTGGYDAWGVDIEGVLGEVEKP